jgi:hypothetical protein
MGSVYESICSFAERVTREDVADFREHIIDIDGIKVSTRPEGFDGLVANLIKDRTRK